MPNDLEAQAIQHARDACADGRTGHLTVGDLQTMYEAGYSGEEIAAYNAAYGREIERLARIANGGEP